MFTSSSSNSEGFPLVLPQEKLTLRRNRVVSIPGLGVLALLRHGDVWSLKGTGVLSQRLDMSSALRVDLELHRTIIRAK